MSTATRTTAITDPAGIHARPASQFTQAATASGCTVTISKQPGTPGVNASSILSVMGLGIKQGDTVEITVDGENAETVADELIETLTQSE
ncbi:HPr family phosphocarrier protein [Bifidobacterium bombi]|uniref:Phosphocarrier protein HPr n=1 Tax=Bifidobacterium bombi DSM 19703 TaxID=1341695 RepID=A0A080N3A5_9BIFI|nr:HPr family phosphocarrier protein [Bifidobacterium bombi]KFF31618.1 phosphocarrier protein HPr [Bifidobacterium bombi DSM 19703]